MSWFDKLLGRTDAAPPAPSATGWASSSDQTRAATTDELLLAVASRAGVAAPLLAPHPPGEHRSELRGTIRGLALRVVVDHDGDVRDIDLRYARRGGFIDLAYDPDLEAVTPSTVAPWDPSDKKVFLAPGIYVGGSDAEQEAAAFRAFPAPLQARILADMKRLRMRYFRSRPDNHAVSLIDDAPDVADPVAWLAEVLALSADVAIARGALPEATGADAPVAATARADQVAAQLVARLPGARLVRRNDGRHLDVRVTTGGVAARVVLDVRFSDVEVEAHAPDVAGAFELSRDDEPEVPPAAPAGAEVWDLPDAVLLLSPEVNVSGPPADVRRAAALLAALSPSLLAELIEAIESLELDLVDFEAEVVNATACKLDAADVVERAARLVELFARVAAALPRSPDLLGSARVTTCPSCHALTLAGRGPCPACAA